MRPPVRAFPGSPTLHPRLLLLPLRQRRAKAVGSREGTLRALGQTGVPRLRVRVRVFVSGSVTPASVTLRIVPTHMSALSRQVASAAVAEAVRAVQVGVGVSVRVARPMPNLFVGFGPRMAGATKVTNASFPMNALGLRLQCLLRPSPQVRRNRQRKPVGGRPAVHHPGEQTVPREAEAQSRDLLPLS